MKKRFTKTGGQIRPIAAESGPTLPAVPPDSDPNPDPIPSKPNPPTTTSAHSDDKAPRNDDGESLLPLVQVARSSAASLRPSRLPLSHTMPAKRAAAAKASTSVSSGIPPTTAPSSDSGTIQDVEPATTEPASPKVSVRHSIPKPPVSSASSPASKSSAPPASKTTLQRWPAVSQSGATVPLSSTRASGFRSGSVRQASSGPASPSPSSASLVKQKAGTAPGAIPRSPGITPPSLPKRPTSVIPRSQPTSSASIGASSSPTKRAVTTAPARKPPPSSRDTFASVGLVVKELSAVARDGSDLFLPLRAALIGLVALRDIIPNPIQVEAEFAKLTSRVLAFNIIAESRQAELNEMKRGFKKYLSSIAEAVQALWQLLEQMHARSGFVRGERASANLDSQPARLKRDTNNVLSLLERITFLLEIFEVDGKVAINDRLASVLSRIVLPQGPGNASTASLSIVSHTGNTTYNFGRDVLNNNYVHNYVFTQKQEAAMKTIKLILGDNFVSDAADYEQPSYAGCMEGTRISVLSKFIMWVKNDPMAIFWLAGIAGMGKTSIAVTLCRMLSRNSEVVFGGGYFCSRSSGSIARTDVRRILPTLAAILAGRSKVFAEMLAAELEKDRNLGHKPVVDQMTPLLRRPLERIIQLSCTVVFLIDALDECSDQLELAELLTLIADSQFDGKVKFILTCRPELHIRGTPISNPAHNTILQLHTISEDEVTSDIRLYITGTLNNTAPHATWYTDGDIDLLVKLSAGIFIFASTVLRYVLCRTGDEDRRKRLYRATTATRTAGTASIDKIYELILMDASQPDMTEDDELERMKDVLACIMSARASLSVEALASLIRVSPGELRGSLERLHSLVHLPDEDTLPGVRTLHASLGDYLFERAPPRLRIANTLGHDLLARGCLLRLARDDLCFNVSQCQSSFEPTPEGGSDGIPPSLAYACLHWAHHIDSASSRSTFDKEVGQIFREKFLSWLEVICVLGKIGLASGLLRIAGSAVKEPTASQFLRDANVFVASSYAAISTSVPHIYISALPFAAKDSLIYRDFVPLCTGLLSVTTFGINRHGGRLVATLVGHEDAVNSVSYSRDGRLLASGSRDGTVRIWNTLTGDEYTSPLRSNDGEINSVAFAPDGQWAASGGNGEVVHVWSLTTGQPALPPMCHSQQIRSVAVSPSGTVIASGSDDFSVCLWSSTTGQNMFVLKGHESRVEAVAFSPDGRLVVSASEDETIRLWDAGTGKAGSGTPIHTRIPARCVGLSPDGKRFAVGSGNSTWVTIRHIEKPDSNQVKIRISARGTSKSLTFSPDGTKLFSGGDEQIIRCWDSQIGQEIPRLSLAGHASAVHSITLSQDGRFLASGSADCTVRIWDTMDRVEEVSQPMQAHSESILSVAVSQDGTSIISGSVDRSVRIWNARTGAARLPPLLGHSGCIRSVAISLDGRLIASGADDRTVRLWDAQTGVPVGDPLRGHNDQVNTVAFSPDARWLASGSQDKSLCVWDIETGSTLYNLAYSGWHTGKIAFSPDGRLLAAVNNNHVHLWLSGTDQQTREPINVGCSLPDAVFFSPDSTRIGAYGDECKIWDIESGHEVLSLRAYDESVNSAAYSPDGRYIVSSSSGMIHIWDANTGADLFILPSHADWVHSLTFTSDGMFIIFSDGYTIHTWNVEAVLSLPSQAEHNPTARLGLAPLDEDGWLVGSSGGLLLWVPPDYRKHIQLWPCSMTIASRRVVLDADDGMHWGEQWTKCWRNVPLSERSSV